MPSPEPLAVALAALPVELSAGSGAPPEIRLLPAGPFRSLDTRPESCAAWRLDAAAAARMVAAAAARVSDYVIDFEHQTLRAADNGRPAPAAGWFKTLEHRADGLYATGVRWTAEAARMIAAGEYRYISPVFSYHPKSGAISGLSAVAPASLVNAPGLDGLTDLARLAALAFPETRQPEPVMPENDFSEDPAASIAALNARIAQLAAQAAAPDPSKFVALSVVDALRAEFAGKTAALAAELDTYRQKERDALLAGALADGLLTPAETGWAKDYLSKDAAGFAVMLGVRAPVVVPGATQTGGRAPAGAGGGAALSDSDVQAAALLGQSAEFFSKHQGA